MSLQGRTVVVSREVVADLDTPVSAYLKIRGDRPSFLLESVEGGERLGRYSFLGSRPRRVLRICSGRQSFDAEDPTPCRDPIDAVRLIIDEYRPALPRRSRFEGGALGYISYEAATYFERLPRAAHDPLAMPDAAYLDVDTMLIFDHVAHKIRVVSHAWLDRPLEQAYSEAVDRIDELVALLEGPVPASGSTFFLSSSFNSNMPRAGYEAMVRCGREHILAGDILQVVLSQRLTADVEGDSFDFYRRLRTVSPSPYMYYLDFGDHQIVGASPELLLQVEGSVVSARPIAGTRRRGSNAHDDEELSADLLADEKERAEHLMLVDLARNDVGRVSMPGSVRVPQFMTVERFSHVMHLVSDVVGNLRDDCNPYDALRAAFPAGTVSGAPKIRAMEIIADLERDRRGAYAGAVGFINASGDMEMAITIRTALVQGGKLHVQAGAGIVADSVPEQEYLETMNKARAVLEAAGSST